MSTSFYGSLPESTTSDNATSVPIPITTTVTRTYVEYTSSPEVSSVESAKKYTKYLDEADLDFEKTFQQQSPLVTTTTSTTQNVQSSSTITSSDKKETSSSQSTVEKEESSSIKKEEKLWDKPLGTVTHKNISETNIFIILLKSYLRLTVTSAVASREWRQHHAETRT